MDTAVDSAACCCLSWSWEAAGSSEILLNFCQIMQCHVPKASTLHSHCLENDISVEIWMYDSCLLNMKLESLGYNLLLHIMLKGVLDSVVSIANCYRLDSLVFIPQWGQDFLYHPHWLPWPSQPPVQWVPGLFPGCKEAGVRHSPPTHQLLALRLKKG
jgi:hypothetical protein